MQPAVRPHYLQWHKVFRKWLLRYVGSTILTLSRQSQYAVQFFCRWWCMTDITSSPPPAKRIHNAGQRAQLSPEWRRREKWEKNHEDDESPTSDCWHGWLSDYETFRIPRLMSSRTIRIPEEEGRRRRTGLKLTCMCYYYKGYKLAPPGGRTHLHEVYESSQPREQ